MSILTPTIGESTLRIDGPHGLPFDFDVDATPIGLPTITNATEAYGYGLALGGEGLDLRSEDLPLDLVDYALEGHAVGVAEQINRALLDDAPTDADLVEGVAEWSVLPTPEELAYRIRKVVSAMTGSGPLSTFIRAALTNIAGDVEAFEARTWAELQAREWEMAQEAFDPGPCPACSREAIR